MITQQIDCDHSLSICLQFRRLIFGWERFLKFDEALVVDLLALERFLQFFFEPSPTSEEKAKDGEKTSDGCVKELDRE